MTLENFLLFEWFPRSPGLFYTDYAMSPRDEAMFRVISVPRSPGLAHIDYAMTEQNVRDYMYIFDPYGKTSMLKGDIGSIRLKPRVIETDKVWFM
jgi:hypothetical protein